MYYHESEHEITCIEIDRWRGHFLELLGLASNDGVVDHGDKLPDKDVGEEDDDRQRN